VSELDAQRLFDDAVALVVAIEAEWDSLGRPLTAEGGATGRALVPHPLVKMLQEARRDVDRFRAALGKRHAGPEPVAVPGIRKSRSAKLRAVG
jgi:hypothetical protein